MASSNTDTTWINNIIKNPKIYVAIVAYAPYKRVAIAYKNVIDDENEYKEEYIICDTLFRCVTKENWDNIHKYFNTESYERTDVINYNRLRNDYDWIYLKNIFVAAIHYKQIRLFKDELSIQDAIFAENRLIKDLSKVIERNELLKLVTPYNKTNTLNMFETNERT